VKPTKAPKSRASTQLDNVEVCRGGVFACSKGAMDASRSKCCREPFRGELRNLGADVVTVSSEEALSIVWAALARAERQTDVWKALEVSSFAFMHSNQQRCESDRTICVMVDPNFQATIVRRPGAPRATAGDSEVPLKAT
jgi:hypothetical protein